MEKRFLLAAALSFMVIYAWGLINPRPKAVTPKLLANNNLQQKQSEIQIQTNQIVSDLSPQKINEIEEVLTTIETDQFILTFSNLGGILKQAKIKQYDIVVPVSNFQQIKGFEDQEYTINQFEENRIVYSAQIGEIEIIKSYVMSNDYDLEASIDLRNESEMSILKNIQMQGFTLDMSRLDNNKKADAIEKRDQGLFEYVISNLKNIERKNKAFNFTEKENKDVNDKVNWIGFRDRYFAVIYKPHDEKNNGYKIETISATKLDLSIKYNDINIPAYGNVHFDSTIFIGPEIIDILKEYKMGFEEIKMFYKNGLLDGISKIIYRFMHLIHKYVPNWGLTIIIISIIVYFSMYPLTLRGLMSMKKMQALQPQMAELKEKHKNNPQKLNKEVMELYKQQKINPLGGCLPMLLQMPVFIGLYQVLWRSVSFKGAEFLWIKDLSLSDRLFILPFNIPLLNSNEFNLFPLLIVVFMALQQRLNSKNMVNMDPDQAQQQKMMAIMMPLFLGFIFYKFASGLTLYFTMFYLFSTLTQLKISSKSE